MGNGSSISEVFDEQRAIESLSVMQTYTPPLPEPKCDEVPECVYRNNRYVRIEGRHWWDTANREDVWMWAENGDPNTDLGWNGERNLGP